MAQYLVQLLTDSSKPSATAGVPHRLSCATFKEMPLRDDKGNKILDANGKEKKKPKHANRCVSIPDTQIIVQPDVIRAAMQAKFHSLQDDVVKDIIVRALDAGTTNADGTLKQIVITDDQISLEACAKFHASTNGGKLSKDVLTQWFNTDMLDAIAEKLAAQMQLPAEPNAEEAATLDAMIEKFRLMFVAMAAPQVTVTPDDGKQLKYALKFAPDSRIKETLAEKIATAMAPPKVAIASGFIIPDDDETTVQQ